MPNRNRNIQGGKSVTSDLAPRSPRISSGQVNSNWVGVLPLSLPIPTFSAASQTTGGWTATITNFDAANTYTLSTTAGSVSRSGSTITQSGLGNGVTTTVTVTVTRNGYVGSVGTRIGTSTPNCSSCTYAYTAVEGGNCGTCGIFGGGQPSSISCYDIVYYTGSPSGCIGCAAGIGGWYTCGGDCCGSCGIC